jgi:hypothetical protein
MLTIFVGALNSCSLDMLPVIFMSYAIGLINELAERLGEFGHGVEVVETRNGPGTSRKKLFKPSQKARKQEMIKWLG